MNEVNKRLREASNRAEQMKEQSKREQLIRLELRKLKEEDMKLA